MSMLSLSTAGLHIQVNAASNSPFSIIFGIIAFGCLLATTSRKSRSSTVDVLSPLFRYRQVTWGRIVLVHNQLLIIDTLVFVLIIRS